MSCWGEQQVGEGSRVAEAECEHTVGCEWIGRVVEAGLGCERTGWCCTQGPLWITELRCCKEAKT